MKKEEEVKKEEAIDYFKLSTISFKHLWIGVDFLSQIFTEMSVEWLEVKQQVPLSVSIFGEFWVLENWTLSRTFFQQVELKRARARGRGRRAFLAFSL